MIRPAAALLWISLAASAAIAQAAGIADPAYREFKDWLVACDNTGRCEARGFVDDGGDQLYLILERDAGAGAIPVLRLGALEDDRLPQALYFDGRRLALDPRDWRTQVAESENQEIPGSYWLRNLTPRAASAFVDAARRTSGVRTQADVAGPSATLSGFNAALLFMDQAQGRIGTRSALLRRGPLSDERVAAARKLPVLTPRPWPGRQPDAGEARRYLQRMKSAGVVRQNDCDNDTVNEQPDLRALNAEEVLVFIPCMRAAYQSSSLIYRGPRRRPERALPLELIVPPALRNYLDDASMNPDYDAATATLSSYSKGRGLFDCGQTSQWVFDGKAFSLGFFSMQARCGGMLPGDFPVLWRSAIRARRADAAGTRP